jgi:hypothetical protein
MAFSNPHVDYAAEVRGLREAYAYAFPQARLNVIRKRLRPDEIGPARLVTVVSAVEALARSLAIHASARFKREVAELYAKYKQRAPVSLVEEVLHAHRHPDPSAYFAEDTWTLFKHAVEFRNCHRSRMHLSRSGQVSVADSGNAGSAHRIDQARQVVSVERNG